jgi:hypothetical protein
MGVQSVKFDEFKAIPGGILPWLSSVDCQAMLDQNQSGWALP